MTDENRKEWDRPQGASLAFPGHFGGILDFITLQQV